MLKALASEMRIKSLVKGARRRWIPIERLAYLVYHVFVFGIRAARWRLNEITSVDTFR